VKEAPQLPVQDAEKKEDYTRIYDINIMYSNVLILDQEEKQEEKNSVLQNR